MQVDTSGISQNSLSASVISSICTLIAEGWNSDKAAVESFLLSLAAYVRERLAQVNDHILVKIFDVNALFFVKIVGLKRLWMRY